MLIDRYMPEWDERTEHSARIEAPVERVWQALWAVDIGRIRMIRFLFVLRGLPAWRLSESSRGRGPAP